MTDKQKSLADQILEALSANPGVYLKPKEILSLVKIQKHHYSELTHILTAMAKSGQLERESRGFRLPVTKPAKTTPGPRKDAREKAQTPAAEKTAAPTPSLPVGPKGNIMLGTFDGSPLARNRSFAFVLLPGDTDVYVSSEDVSNAFHGDKVEVEVRRRNERYYGRVLRVVERARKQVIGNLYRTDRKFFLVPDNLKLHREFQVQERTDLQPGHKVVLDVDNWGDPDRHQLPIGHVTEILGEAGEPEVEILGVIRQFELPMTFPDEVLNAADAIPTVIPEEEIRRRTDLRNIITFTVDPASAKDYDDAISLETLPEGWRLYVHIADVAHYVRPGSILFNEAVNRGNSYYFPRRVLPMLPEKVSNGLCSLRPDEDKLTMTVVTEYDRKAQVVKQSLAETVIRSNARLTYEEVDALFAGQPQDIPPEVAKVLIEARKLSKIITRKRIANGCLFFNMPEVEYVFNDEGYVVNLDRSVDTESHTLIENFMLAANEHTASLLMKTNHAAIYRVHESPDMEKVNTLLELIATYGYKVKPQKNPNKLLQQLLIDIEEPLFHRVFDRIILRSMKKARYGTEPLGHFGLAMKNYTHFTSPIRRLCDLLVHHLLKVRVLKSRHDDISSQDLEEMAKVASDKELLADASEREVNRINVLAFMRKHVGETYPGVISGVHRNSLQIELDEMPVTGFIPVEDLPHDSWSYDERQMRMIGKRSGREYRLMQTMRVQVLKVVDEVEFRPLKDKPVKKGKK